MGHGGRRPGAGRPKGSKDRRNWELVEEVLDGGMTPLEYMISIMRDDSKVESERFDAAKAAAPYVHARISSIEASVESTATSYQEMTNEEIAKQLNEMIYGCENPTQEDIDRANAEAEAVEQFRQAYKQGITR